MTRHFVLPLVVLGLATGLPTTASAQQCVGRPGASAVEQYCEAIPNASGDRVEPGGRSPASGVSGVPSRTASTLQRAGADGATVLALVSAAGDVTPGDRAGRQEKGGTQEAQAEDGAVAGISAASAPSANPLKAVSSAVSSGTTVGPAFLMLLLGLTVIVLGTGWVRFRRGSSGR